MSGRYQPATTNPPSGVPDVQRAMAAAVVADAACRFRVHVAIGDPDGDRYPITVSVLDGSGTVMNRRHGNRSGRRPNRRPSRRTDPTSSPSPRPAALFDLLARAGLDDVWATHAPVPLLLDIAPQEPAILPWELLRDPQATPARSPTGTRPPPGAAAVRPAARRCRRTGPTPRDRRRPADKPDLGQDNEIEAIYKELRRAPCGWHIDVLRGPTKEQLTARYRDFAPGRPAHHRTRDEGLGRPGRADAAAGREPWDLDAEFLVGNLPDGLKPRLTVLNACRTADQPHEALELARGLADALLDKGASAVVAMQGDIAPDPAACFTEHLYAALGGPAPVPLDFAVAQARAAVGRLDVEPRDWVLPRLTLRADPAILLHQPQQVLPADLIRAHPGFGEVMRMVDRSSQRRLVQRLDAAPPCDGPGSQRPAVRRPAAAGDRQDTADALLCGVKGRPRRSGGLPQLGGAGLRARCGLPAQPGRCRRAVAGRPCGGAVPGHHGGAVQGVGREEVPMRYGAALARAPQPAPPPALLLTPARPQDPIQAAYSMVRDLLGHLAGSGTMVLVLDHVYWIDEKRAVVSGLIEPAARGDLAGVRVVLVEESKLLEGIAGQGTAVSMIGSRDQGPGLHPGRSGRAGPGVPGAQPTVQRGRAAMGGGAHDDDRLGNGGDAGRAAAGRDPGVAADAHRREARAGDADGPDRPRAGLVMSSATGVAEESFAPHAKEPAGVAALRGGDAVRLGHVRRGADAGPVPGGPGPPGAAARRPRRRAGAAPGGLPPSRRPRIAATG